MHEFRRLLIQKLDLPDHIELSHLLGFGTTNQNRHMHADGLAKCIYQWGKDTRQSIDAADEQSISNVRRSWLKISATHVWASSGLITPVSSSSRSLTLLMAASCALLAFEFHSPCSSSLNIAKRAFLNSLHAWARSASRLPLALNSSLNCNLRLSKWSFPHSCHPAARFPGPSLLPSNLLSKRLMGLLSAFLEICNFLTFLLR